MIGDTKDKQISNYQPPQEVIELMKPLIKAYAAGHENLHRTWKELNDYSVIGRMNKDQLTFNSFVDESVEDPREAWKWRGTRGQARKNTMAMHAHLTSQYIIPNVFAQNEAEELDREMSDIAHDALEWMTINSNYRSSFLLATMGMLVNPVTYLGAEYNEVFQKVKCKTDEGYEIKEVLDEVLSGFQAPVYSADQVLIGNAYEQNIQKQKIVPKRRYIDYEEAKAMHGDHPNWQYVTKGVKSVYSDDDGLFYDVKDDDHSELVEEVTFYWRREDCEVTCLNGVYFGDENVNLNPMTHRDNRNTPRVPLAPFGYERVNEHFFFYKSLVNNIGWDHELLDQMYQITMNKELMELLPPLAFKGIDKVDTEVVMPGTMFASNNEDFDVKRVFEPNNNSAGYNAMATIEKSMSDASINDVQRGQLPDANQKAFNVATAKSAAEVMISGVAKTLGESVMQYGMLMLDIAINHLTVAQLDEITGKPKYPTLLLENQTVGGKQVDKKILFDESLVGRRLSKKQKDQMAVEAYEKTMKNDGNEYLYRVNPHLWSKIKYLTRVEPDTMIPKNQVFEKQLSQQMYTLLRQDPLISPEVLVRKLITTHYRGEENDFMVEQSTQNVLGAAPEGETATPGTVPSAVPAPVG